MADPIRIGRTEIDYSGRLLPTSFDDTDLDEQALLARAIDTVVILPDGTEAVDWPDGNRYRLTAAGIPDFDNPL